MGPGTTILLVIFLALIIVIAGYFYMDWHNKSQDKIISESKAQEEIMYDDMPEEIKAPEKKKADEPNVWDEHVPTAKDAEKPEEEKEQ